MKKMCAAAQGPPHTLSFSFRFTSILSIPVRSHPFRSNPLSATLALNANYDQHLHQGL